MNFKPILKIFGFSFLFSLFIGIALTYRSPAPLNQLAPQKPQILGISGGGRSTSYRPPQMFVYGGDNSFGAGGVISMSSSDDPTLAVTSYNLSGSAMVSVYKASLADVLKYLEHDSENMQITKQVDSSGFEFIGSGEHVLSSGGNTSTLALPIEGRGIWFVNLKIQGISLDGFIIRSDHGILAKEGDNEFVFWGQNFSTQQSVNAGQLQLYNLQGGQQPLSTVSLGSDGLATTPLDSRADLAIYTNGDDLSLLPLNLRYLNWGYGYSSFTEKLIRPRYFIFTDRPLYQPGDTVNFKAIIRTDDDARYSIPSGNAKITFSHNGETQHEQSYPISSDGSVSGSYVLESNSSVGGYQLTVETGPESKSYSYGEYYSPNSLYFEVQHYQKPDSFISVDSTSLEYISGQDAELIFAGSYFSGQPLIAQELKYKITAVDYYEYSHYSDQVLRAAEKLDTFYGSWYGSEVVKEGVVSLDHTGQASLLVDTKQFTPSSEYSSYTPGQAKIFSVEATLDDGSLTPSLSRKSFIVYAGEYGLYQTSNTWGTKVNSPYNLDLITAPHFKGKSVSSTSLTANVVRRTWVKSQENTKYQTYTQETEELGTYNLKTNKEGKTSFSFTPEAIGSYQIQVTGSDSLNNYIAKDFYFYATSTDTPIYSGEWSAGISLTLDKTNYAPGDTAQLTIVSDQADRDYLLTIERGRVDRYQVVSMSGRSATVNLVLETSDVPNIYLSVASFDQFGLDSASLNLPVSAHGQHLVVTISPEASKYGPGETLSLDLTTATPDGSPRSAEVALWAVDKAIFELADSNLGDIFDTFWSERGNSTSESHSLMGIITQQAEGGGGCFLPDTSILLSNGQTKAIKEVKAGDYVLTRSADNQSLVKAKVIGTHVSQVGGYLVVNDSLSLTSDHILRVNGAWTTAGHLQLGDYLTDARGEVVTVESLYWQLGKYEVYNLEIESEHTFIADGFWVHNQKGGARAVFKDTAYWNPSIKTDAKGQATVRFKLPDNLTTWTIAAVAATSDSVVGQDTTEVMVTKDIIVRPIMPNIMRVGDEIYLSALVQNFTSESHTFTVQLSFDGGDVEQNTWENVIIPENNLEQLYWKLTPTHVRDDAKITIKAVGDKKSSLSDEITVTLPILRFGFLEQTAQVGIGTQSYPLSLSDNLDLSQSSVNVSLSPSLFGTLPSALDYLAYYTYACVEQTVSRLVPALLLADQPALFGNLSSKQKYDSVIDKSLERLSLMQRGDGGFTWWFSGPSSPHITGYVVETLSQAQRLGYQLKPGMLERAQDYLVRLAPNASASDLVLIKYSLQVSGKPLDGQPLKSFEGLSPDILALAVMHNYNLGDHNPTTNGLKYLTSLGQSQGEGMFWDAGDQRHFGTVATSTALSLQAILKAGGDPALADQAVLYLTRSRQNNYWDNTYATARITQALTTYAGSSFDLTPNFQYKINLGEKSLAQGSVNSAKQVLEDVLVPLDQIKNSPTLEVVQTGEGNLYSTILKREFLTGQEIKSQSRGISISKRFENTKGSDLAIGVGDTVDVVLSVSGLSAPQMYGVISDELPSGLVPVNTGLKNEANTWNVPANYEDNSQVTDIEVTQNGVVLSLYNLDPQPRDYRYKARVVSAGTFVVPPATISLMYTPEVHGRSQAEQITINKTSGTTSGTLTNRFIWRNVYTIAVILLALAGITTYIYLRRNHQASEPSTHDKPQAKD